MSSDETLKDMIDKSRKDLAVAKGNSVATKRDGNVCAGHDALFNLTQTVADGVYTTLSVLAGMLGDEVSKQDKADQEPSGAFATFSAYARVMTPFRWPIALAVFSPFAGNILEKVVAIFKS